MPPGLTIYIPLALVGLCFTLLITLPLAVLMGPLSVMLGLSVLWWPLSWIHTSNDDLDGGQEQAGYRRGARGGELMWQRICWIWRNPSSGFFGEVLGIPKAGTVLEYENVFDGGWYSVWRTAKGRRYFGYRRILPIWGGHLIMWFGWRYYPDNPDMSKHPKYYDLCLDFHHTDGRITALMFAVVAAALTALGMAIF